jgi:hypothetical protein
MVAARKLMECSSNLLNREASMDHRQAVTASAFFVATAGSLLGLQLLPTRDATASTGSPTARLMASTAAVAQAAPPPAIPSNPDRNVYFGQTHSHTSWSMDAYVIGNTLTGPAEAYQYSLGMPISHPGGYTVKLSRPLDFQGVTDHSEYLGMVRLASDPTSPVSKLPIAAKFKANTPEQRVEVFKFLVSILSKNEPIKELLDPKLMESVWTNYVGIADKYYQPGKFTTFASYEWTSAPGGQNMHRNVFFRDSKKIPLIPYTAIDSVHPEDLWTWMDSQRQQGNELLAISHNANLSNGLMFPVSTDSKGKPLTPEWAQQRLANEPLTEIRQIKGTSETTPELSPNDEFAGYELMSFLLGTDNSTSNPHGSYVREAYENGLLLLASRGYNPYKFGIVGASDSHDTSVAYTDKGFTGGHGIFDDTPKARLAGKIQAGMEVLKTGVSGLAGVWAEQNTRESIFDAMRRKETYGTSGVRIKVRLFGGWDYKESVLREADWVKTGYRDGVPMGGDLRPRTGGAAPSFIVWALKDPDDGNLDRIQIVKGWSKNGELFEKVYDVAWAGDRRPDPRTGKVPAIRSTVDIKNASYTNTVGAVELKKVWRDPDFDPSIHAFYYVRVLQIPTPRWSTYDAKTLGVPVPTRVPPTVQERAWTSPIWYAPSTTKTGASERGAFNRVGGQKVASKRGSNRNVLNAVGL